MSSRSFAESRDLIATALLALWPTSACNQPATVEPDAMCNVDCAGTCNGSASLDRCGVCDSDPSNDCWKGRHGTATVLEFPKQTNVGTGGLTYSINDVATQRGYFYYGSMTSPTVEIAQTTAVNGCDPTGFPDVGGYVGLSSVHELVDAASLAYSSSGTVILFGTEASTCSSGLLVYRQSNLYGVLRFRTINSDQTLDVEYWVGEAGVVDFRNAP